MRIIILKKEGKQPPVPPTSTELLARVFPIPSLGLSQKIEPRPTDLSRVTPVRKKEEVDKKYKHLILNIIS